jgi:hypothetical protein
MEPFLQKKCFCFLEKKIKKENKKTKQNKTKQNEKTKKTKKTQKNKKQKNKKQKNKTAKEKEPRKEKKRKPKAEKEKRKRKKGKKWSMVECTVGRRKNRLCVWRGVLAADRADRTVGANRELTGVARRSAAR